VRCQHPARLRIFRTRLPSLTVYGHQLRGNAGAEVRKSGRVHVEELQPRDCRKLAGLVNGKIPRACKAVRSRLFFRRFRDSRPLRRFCRRFRRFVRDFQTGRPLAAQIARGRRSVSPGDTVAIHHPVQSKARRHRSRYGPRAKPSRADQNCTLTPIYLLSFAYCHNLGSRKESASEMKRCPPGENPK
jgi:hypothetical protein